jgi:threonyl-tRNA synthetase
MLHVDRFASTVTEKGRSPLVEPADPKETAVDEALLVLVAAEAGDEADVGSVAARAADEIARQATRVKAATVVLHPFAHLFADLAPPAAAVAILKAAAGRLADAGLTVRRTPFGWFSTLEIRAKGHPLSRVARTVRPAEAPA